jgi:hypothetical protein
LAFDDRTFEDASVVTQDYHLIMAQGFSASMFACKGNLTRAIAKIRSHEPFNRE